VFTPFISLLMIYAKDLECTSIERRSHEEENYSNAFLMAVSHGIKIALRVFVIRFRKDNQIKRNSQLVSACTKWVFQGVKSKSEENKRNKCMYKITKSQNQS